MNLFDNSQKNIMKKITFPLLFLCVVSFLCAQTIDPSFAPKVLRAGVGTTVITQADDKLLVIAQSQGYVDDQAVGWVFRLEENGALDPSFQYPAHLNNAPTTIAIQQDGKILIGGNFKDSNGQYIGSLLRLLQDGTIDPSFNILKDENFTVRQMVVLSNQKIFILEDAIVYISQVRLLSKDGVSLSHFRTRSFDESAAAIGVQSNNELVLAGTKLQIENRTQDVFRFDSTGQVDPVFNPRPTSTSNFVVQNMAILPSGTLGFLAADGTNVSIFDRNGQSVASFSLFNERAFLHRASSTSFIVLGQQGYEVFENGQYRNLQVVNANNYAFWATEQAGNRLILTGPFTTIGGFFRAGLVRLIRDFDNRLTVDQNFSTGLYTQGIVRDILLQKDGKLIVGGDFHRVSGQTATHITRLLPNGTIDPSFNPFMASYLRGVYKIRQQSSGTLVIASERAPSSFFSELNGLNLANPDGYSIQRLNFPYQGSVTSINYLALDQEDKIYAAEGLAYSINGRSGQEFARFSANGVLEANFNQLYINGLRRFNGFTYGKNQKLLLFGEDLRYDQSDTTCFLQLLPSGARDQNFQLNFNKRAVSLTALSIDTTFSMVGGLIRNGFTSSSAFLLKLDVTGQIVQAPNITHTSNNFPEVNELFELPNGRVLVSGAFNRYNNIPVNNHIIIDKNAQLVGNFLPEMPTDATYSTSANIDGNSMYLGGIFNAPNGAVGLVKVTDLLTSSSAPISKVKKGKIFPNPSVNETLYLELDSKVQNSTVQYQMLEMGSGKVLESGVVASPALQTFDVKNLKQGAYVLRLLNPAWEESHIFTKMK